MVQSLHHQGITNMYSSLEENIEFIKQSFCKTEDLIFDRLPYENGIATIVYLETLVDTNKIDEMVFHPIETREKIDTFDQLLESISHEMTGNLQMMIELILSGKSIVLLEEKRKAYIFDTPLDVQRSPDEPDNEKTVRGSHLGFIEDLHTNLSMLRKRIKNTELKVQYMTLGHESSKNIAIIYMDDLANEETVQEIKKRLHSISLDTIFAPGYLEECIEETPLSPFPQNLYTERPDRVEAHLMEGRIAVMSENSTDVIILPVTFFSFFQSPDDYNNRFYAGTVFRLFRLFSFVGTLLLPPIYIALVGFHFEIIPYEMITLVKSSITGIPFPPFFEAILMAITVELIREAGIRLPTPIGETIGIVGGLIIGDAVVNAGIVSNIMVIVIAMTAIMSFTITSYEMSNTVRMLNLPIMIAAAFFGFVGIIFALLFIVIHMCKLESFGTPYLSPLTPLRFQGLKDAIVRFPIWSLKHRPEDVQAKKKIRQGNSREWEYDRQA